MNGNSRGRPRFALLLDELDRSSGGNPRPRLSPETAGLALFVDLRDEDRDATGGEVRNVVGSGLTLVRRPARVQGLPVVEGELGDALVRKVAAIRGGDATRCLEPPQPRNRRR